MDAEIVWSLIVVAATIFATGAAMGALIFWWLR